MVECATAHRTELRFGGRVARLAQFHSATGRAALDAAAALARSAQLPCAGWRSHSNVIYRDMMCTYIRGVFMMCTAHLMSLVFLMMNLKKMITMI